MHGNEQVNVRHIASSLNLSISRFRHVFKREMGISVRQYQKFVRLARAKELLENSVLRVKEITALLGVGDVSHFTRNFKAVYAKTPLQVRAAVSRRSEAKTAISAKQ